MRKGEELKTPRYASAAALRDGRLPNSQQKQSPPFSFLAKRIGKLKGA